MCAGWANWSIGVNAGTPLNISNNQPIESWHKRVMALLHRSLRGSTEHVLGVSFPRMVLRDSINMPDRLNFGMKLEWISQNQYEKALQILNGEDGYVALISEEVQLPNCSASCTSNINGTRYHSTSHTSHNILSCPHSCPPQA